MANNRNKHHPEDEFSQYRQVAPESFSDESLRSLMKSKEHKRDAILAAIENIWHDIPDQQAVGTEWQTASKSKTKDVPVPVRGSTRQGETGGRGGGRSRQSTGGRGNGAERDRKTTKTTSSTPPVANPSPAPTEVAVVNEPVIPVVNVAPVKPTPAAPTITAVSAPSVPASNKPAWGTGTSFVEKMKKDEADKAKAAAVAAAVAALEAQKALEATTSDAVVETNDTAAESKDSKKTSTRTRNRKPKTAGSKKSAESEITEELSKVELEPKSEPVSVPVPDSNTIELSANSDINASAESFAPASSLENANLDSSNGFLKLGKWEAPVASSEMFQFGSFGSFQEEDKNAWGKSAEDTVSSVVQEESAWATSTEQVNLNSNNLNLFQTKIADTAPTRAPPGLEQNSQAKQNSQVRTGGQKYNKEFQQPAPQIPQQPILYPATQQYGPPGIAPVIGNRNTLGTAAPAPAPTYAPYNPSFDLNQNQFLHPNFAAGGIGAAPLPATNTSTTPAPPALSQAAPSSTAAQQQQQQQQAAAAQQQFNAYGFNPYQTNPYYNPYFYNQSHPNFYGQNGRGVYQQQQQRPYNDPYGSNQLYPDLYQGVNQFPDAYTNNGNNNAIGGASASTGNKSNKTGAAGSTPAVGGQVPQDHNAHSFNPYFNRMDPAAAWQYQNQQWGGHMMFPNPPAAGSQGFVQQQPLGMANPQVPPANSSGQRSQTGSNNYSTLTGNRNNTGVNGAPSATGNQGAW